MQTPEKLFRPMKCCLYNDEHIVHEPIMVKCGGNACKKCIIDIIGIDLKCYFCNQNHSKSEMLKMPSNHIMKVLIEKKYIKELIENLKVKLSEIAEAFDITSLDNEIESKFSLIEHEIDTKIDSLVENLHKIRDSFKTELLNFKQNLQKPILNDHLEEIRATVLKLEKHEEGNQYDDFIKGQNLLRECQNKLENYRNEIQQIAFIPTDLSIIQASIGKLDKINFKFNKIHSSNEYQITSANQLICATGLNLNEKIIVADSTSDKINIINGTKQGVWTHEKIKRPVVVYVDKSDNIFIGDDNPCQILVFDSNMKFLRGFDIFVRVSTIADLVVDNDDADATNRYMYVLDTKQNKISIFQWQSGFFLKSVEVKSAQEMKVKIDKLYVLCEETYGDSNAKHGCILVLDKIKFGIVKTIKLDHLAFVRGLEFEENMNIVLTSASFGNKNETNVPSWRDLVVIDDNGVILFKKKLHDINGGFNYLRFFNNKLIACYDKTIRIIEFDF